MDLQKLIETFGCIPTFKGAKVDYFDYDDSNNMDTLTFCLYNIQEVAKFKSVKKVAFEFKGINIEYVYLNDFNVIENCKIDLDKKVVELKGEEETGFKFTFEEFKGVEFPMW